MLVNEVITYNFFLKASFAPTYLKHFISEQLIQNTNRPPSIKHLDLAMDLMAEFIFCEIERRGGKRKVH